MTAADQPAESRGLLDRFDIERQMDEDVDALLRRNSLDPADEEIAAVRRLLGLAWLDGVAYGASDGLRLGAEAGARAFRSALEETIADLGRES